VVYTKPPFGGPEQVLAYLGRYTHRVAIANSQLISLADGNVCFTWKDYRAHGKTKVMTLDADEFIRRFLLHSLPDALPSHPPLWLPRQWPTQRLPRPLSPAARNPQRFGQNQTGE
jgi:Putative transposase